MRASPEFVTFLIRGLAWDASQSKQPLQDVIELASRAELVNTRRGKVLVGHRFAFHLPPLGNLDEHDVIEACEHLLRHAKRLLKSNPALTDDALAAALAVCFSERRAA
jgi:hypothetical protein